MPHSGHEANYQVVPRAETCRHMPTGQAEPRTREATRGGCGPTFLPSLLQDRCPLSTPTLPGLHWRSYQGKENAGAELHVREPSKLWVMMKFPSVSGPMDPTWG